VLLVFLGYIVTAFLAHPNWGRVLHDTLVPHVSFSSAYVAGALAFVIHAGMNENEASRQTE
jgi:hypothetical protein